MGTVESITVEVSGHDERLALQRKAEWEVVERLKKRIFFCREQGNQRYYYDVKTGTSNLTLMHTIPDLIIRSNFFCRIIRITPWHLQPSNQYIYKGCSRGADERSSFGLVSSLGTTLFSQTRISTGNAILI